MAEIEHIVPEITENVSASAVPAVTTEGELLSKAEHEVRFVAELGDQILRRAQQQAHEDGVERVETLSADGDYADGILDAIDETGADIVVMGRRGLGRMRQLLLGSVSNKVVQHSGSAVLLIQ